MMTVHMISGVSPCIYIVGLADTSSLGLAEGIRYLILAEEIRRLAIGTLDPKILLVGELFASGTVYTRQHA